jgi:two-component system phosphate regulon response regulator PhoB
MSDTHVLTETESYFPLTQTIALVDDDRNILTSVSMALEAEGYRVNCYSDSVEALKAISASPPDIAVLDIKMPRLDGMELLTRLRRENDLPVIFLTSLADETDEALGLRMGADDYITKPFSPRELVARIQAVLRRAKTGDSEVIRAGVLELDTAGHRVTAGGSEVRLGPTEYRLLHFLLTHPDRVYSRTQLLDRVWGANVYVEERTVDVHVRRLRKALTDAGADEYIQTVRGAGYRFSTRNG